MPRNTSVTLGKHFSSFVETKLEILRTQLAEGEAQLKNGESVDGDTFMQSLIDS